MQELKWTSLGSDDVSAIKFTMARGAAYANRLSLKFVYQLLELQQTRGEQNIVLDEINYLEGLSARSSTKDAAQFRYAPLHPFWHKHFYSPRHFVRNVGLRWGVDRSGNRDLAKMISSVAEEYGNDPDRWQKKVAYDFVMGIQDRAADKRMTGDWIIFGKHEGLNFYLGLATHEEGQRPDVLIQELRDSCACEFPFLFHHPDESLSG